jgi:hypothetical protein
MNMTWNLDSRAIAHANKTWRSALLGARDRIRNAHATKIHCVPQQQASNAEILGAAMRVREEFKVVQAGNAQMLQALADYKARCRKLRCERALSGPAWPASALQF